MSAEMGKLHREALAEIDKSAAACDYYAERAGDYLAEQTILTEARRSYVSYEPIGCVLAIMPWNFPIWQVFRFLAPALMADRKSVVSGKSVSVRVDLGGRRIIKKKKEKQNKNKER